ncbi:bacteriohemerythrin [Desulfocurvus sp. DL9XJH121]
MAGAGSLWKSKFSLDIDVVDEQHKRFFALCNDIREMSRGVRGGVRGADLVRAVVAMRGYAFKHFHTEERLLAKHGFPGLYAHSRLHDAYLRDLLTFGAELAALAGELDAGSHEEFLDLARRISDYTVAWWSEHIMTKDTAYARFLRDRMAGKGPGAGLDPEVPRR